MIKKLTGHGYDIALTRTSDDFQCSLMSNYSLGPCPIPVSYETAIITTITTAILPPCSSLRRGPEWIIVLHFSPPSALWCWFPQATTGIFHYLTFAASTRTISQYSDDGRYANDVQRKLPPLVADGQMKRPFTSRKKLSKSDEIGRFVLVHCNVHHEFIVMHYANVPICHTHGTMTFLTNRSIAY